MENREELHLFDAEKEFFLIDSEHLEDVCTNLYGYSVQDTGIYENNNLTDIAVDGMDGRGAYVYVENNADSIIIKQDYNGSYGIYLFRKEGYFALSNSFFRLLEHVKYKYPLSVNYDYSNYFFLEHLSSLAYSETPAREIQRIDKGFDVIIEKKEASLKFDLSRRYDNSVELDSKEAMSILDGWYFKWISIIQNLKSRTDQINIDLSGGFDSRMVLLLVLKSGINLNEIRVRSVNDEKHTHKEDYKIASEIADYYGFKLNNLKFSEEGFNYSMDDVQNILFHTKMAFHKEFYFHRKKYAQKRYSLRGMGGEAIRSHWDQSAQEFMDTNIRTSTRYSKYISGQLADSMRTIIQNGYCECGSKYEIKDADSKEYPFYLYRHTRTHSHFGKTMVVDYFANIYELTPLLDPDLWRIKLNVPECEDNNLLMAVIYMRYCPKLLEFPFEGGRSISRDTIQFAKMLNDRFPFEEEPNRARLSNDYGVLADDKEVYTLLKSGVNNPLLASEAPERYLKEIFDSCAFEKMFETCFDEEIYKYAKHPSKGNNYYPMRERNAILGITKVIEAVWFSHQINNNRIIHNSECFIGQNCPENGNYEIVQRNKKYLTARIDIKLEGDSADFAVISASDPRADISKPAWLQTEGMGFVIESYNGTIDIEILAKTEGKLNVSLKSKLFYKEDGSKEQNWIDYQEIKYNGKSELGGLKSAWHNKPIVLTHSVNAGDKINIHADWTIGVEHYATEEMQLKNRLSSEKGKREDVQEKLKIKNKELQELHKQIKQKEHDLDAAEAKIQKYSHELDDIKGSVSYRFGKAAFALPRKIKHSINNN